MTVVAIHQPQYLPWIPYFAKAERCDVFVYLDDVQYQKGGVQNRNQVKTANGPVWLTVPVRASLGQSIMETGISGNAWSANHLRTIEQSYSRAEHLTLLREGLSPLLERPWTQLGELDIAVCEWMFGQLGVSCKRVRSSELDVGAGGGEREHKDDLVLAVCEAVGASCYVSGRGAMAYQDERKFEAKRIELRYADYEQPTYRQCHPKLGFLPDLSALDLILNLGPQARAALLSGLPDRKPSA